MKPKMIKRVKGGYEYHKCTECMNIDTITKPYKTEMMKCTECGKFIDGLFNNYCDNCGVKVDGGDTK